MPEPEMDEIREALAANDFSKARRLLETFLTAPGVDSKKLTWVRQKFALSTYKDKETAGASRNDVEKWAYGSVNAAFVLDLLAAEEGSKTAAPSRGIPQ